MKISGILFTTVFAQESSGEQPEVEIESKSTDEGILLDGDSTPKLPTIMELVEPLYQECQASIDCENKVPARCRGLGESCAQSDPINNPCDYHCVTECPENQESVLVEGYNGKTFRKCVPLEQIQRMSSFRCSSDDATVPQFEMQVPKIIKHKYIKDNRFQTLIPFYEEGVSFANSSCLHVDETENFLIFRGPLEGVDECQINHFVEFDDENLYDIYSGMPKKGTIGYDDLVGKIGSREVVYRKGAHHDFECRIKRSGKVDSDLLAEGDRLSTNLTDEAATEFEILRCTDESCEETTDSSIINISPDSLDDPMLWFKVRAKTDNRYAHLRSCSLTFGDGDVAESFDVIENGCSMNAPFTVLDEVRETVAFDKIGQIAFMDLDKLSELTMSIECTVDACLPPAFGVYSCEVASACQGRYDPIYSTYGIETNEPFRRKRSSDDETSGVVKLTVEHPCARITEDDDIICIEAEDSEPNAMNRCWTRAICDAHRSETEETKINQAMTGDAAVSLASATTLALSAYFML